MRNPWTTPSFEEIKMDAEVGSYQADDSPIVEGAVEESETPAADRDA